MKFVKLGEPPYTERYVRWCERTGVSHPLLLDFLVHSLKQIHSSSPLMAARVIRTALKDSFEEEISKALYGSIDNAKEGTSNLLSTIANLCVGRRIGPGVKAVVTYNFDNLLEKQLNKAGVLARPIYNDKSHGFLPEDANERREYEGLSESLLVFSEEGYHALLLDPYSWANITQLNFFRENTCLFIGLSMIF